MPNRKTRQVRRAAKGRLMFYGGGQEAGLRPGTENTPVIAGLGAACWLVTWNLDIYSRHMRTVRDFLVDHLIRNFSLVTADEANTRLGLGEVCWRYLDPLCLPNTLSIRMYVIYDNPLQCAYFLAV